MAAPFERFPGAPLPLGQLEGDPAQAVARVHEALLPSTVGHVTLADIARNHDGTSLGRAHPRVRAMLADLTPSLERVGDQMSEVYHPDTVDFLEAYKPSADAGPPPAEELFPYGPERFVQFLPDAGVPYTGVYPSPAEPNPFAGVRVPPQEFNPALDLVEEEVRTGIRALPPAPLRGMTAAKYMGRVKPAGSDPELLTGAEYSTDGDRGSIAAEDAVARYETLLDSVDAPEYTTDADRPIDAGYEDEEERR